MTEPLVPLDALGERFRRLGEPPAPRRNPVPRALVIAVALALLLAGVAAAAILITRGAPLPAPNAEDLSSSGVPIPGSAHLAGLDARDPDAAAPPWDIRISRTRAGETCTAVGQVLGGQFGIVGLDHVFRALPLGGVDACGVQSPNGPLLAGARVFLGDASTEARTVVNGIAGAGARSVTAYGPEGARHLTLGPDSSFITVYRGYLEDVRPHIVVVTSDGRSHTIAFASSVAFEVADPDGGSPWKASGDPALSRGSYPDESCAQVSQELGRSDPSRDGASMTPEVCGRLGQQPLFVLMRRFVPGSGEATGYPWSNKPARTLVYGAVSRRVASLTLSGVGAVRVVPIDAHGGVFLAVLDGHIDPHALKLTAHLHDGRSVSYNRSTDIREESGDRVFNNAPPKRWLSEPDDPPYREPLPTSEEFPPSSVPIQSTVRETLHASDPAGGPEWALRSWQGRPNPRARYGESPPARLVCFQVGIRRGGTLFEPRPGASPRPLEVGQEEGSEAGGCNATAYVADHPPVAMVESYTDHPYAYTPTPARTVVAGMLPPDGTHPLLLGAGAPRALSTDANHMFLAVLPGRYWDAPLRVSVVEHGRTIAARAASTSQVPPVLMVPQARAPDPDGGAPWGYAEAANGSSAYGRIVDGRLAGLSEREGAVRNGPMGWGGGEPCFAHRRSRACPYADRHPPAVHFDVQSGAGEGPLEGATPALTPPQIQRRTLEGHTIVTARADPDVVSVTLATPSDVRTLRPGGPQHVFLVVYDGQFFRGAITATILLRDGRTVTQSVQNGASSVGSATPELSLAAALHRDLRELALAGANRHNSSAMQRQGLTFLEDEARLIKQRIAYESSHPDVLPES
ncbi:MAG TPA: hypothetical protein VIJ39_13495 [Solirubrobacteraceae bacterium]